MDNDLICNFKKCRQRLNTFAWVTSCSHIFCDEDGTREFNKSYSCPACETSLSGKFDIIRIDLQPSEQYKSMVLAGQKPETVMEICSRAVSFWTYQAHQERMYQEHVGTKAKERFVQLEQYYEQIVSRTTTELNTLKTQVANSKRELDSTKKKFSECSEKLLEKSRQYQKIQSMYEALRRKCITPSTFDTDMNRDLALRLQSSFDMPIGTGEDILRRQNFDHEEDGFGDRRGPSTPAERDFVLRPRSTPIHVTVSDATLAGTQSRFNMGLGTPSGSQKNRPKP